MKQYFYHAKNIMRGDLQIGFKRIGEKPLFGFFYAWHDGYWYSFHGIFFWACINY